jgi:hypothetical protein
MEIVRTVGQIAAIQIIPGAMITIGIFLGVTKMHGHYQRYTQKDPMITQTE